MEWGSRGGPGITPGLPHAQQKQLWSDWQSDECAKAGQFWNLLAAEHQHPERPIQRIVLERDEQTKDGTYVSISQCACPGEHRGPNAD